MIYPKMTGVYCTQFDVEKEGPRDKTMFCEWLTVDLEAAVDERIYGGEAFSVGVCSNAWIAGEAASLGAV